MNLKISSFRKLLIISMILTGILFNSCNSGQQQSTTNEGGELSGTITLSGAFALYPMVVKWAEEFKKLHPKVRIDVSAGGAGKGMTDALTGIVDLGMFSRSISDAEKAKGVWWVSVVKDAVFPTINSKSVAWETISKTGIKQETFNDIFITKKVNDWSQIDSKLKGQINVFTRSDACGAAEMWASFFKKHQEDLQGTGVFGDPGMADAVKKDVNGIGYNNVVYVYDIKSRKTYDGISVIPLDLNGNGTLDANENFYQNLDSVMSAIKTGRYPSPPSRELYLVSKGKPQKKEVIEFIRFILNQGQKMVMEAGYVELPKQNLENELKKIELMRWISFERERFYRERLAGWWMLIWMSIIILLPFVLGIGLYWKSYSLLDNQSITHLIFSKEFKPMSGKFGLYTFIISSLWVSLLALLIAGPICLLSAVHLNYYAKKYFVKIIHPVIDILSGIPSVVYGVWGILVVVPFISQHIAPFFGVSSSGYSILAGAVVLSIMIIPFILNILIEVFKTIPMELMEASLSLGATKWETIKLVLLRKAFPGIISSFGLGLSRAFGETIAVLMVVGNVPQIPKSVFDAGYPLPALIANNYGEMLSIPMYDSALMLAALVLFVIVMLFNMLSRIMIVRYDKHA